MEEQFIFRVPPSVAARLEKLLNEDPAAAGDANLDLSFQGKCVLVTSVLYHLEYIRY